MSKNQYRLILIISMFLIFITIEFLGNRDDKRKFQAFYNANMNGKLINLSKHKGATDFEISNNEQQFSFVPIDAGNKNFPEFALPGDNIYKPAQSDTLKLMHKGKTYLFTFKKF
jgi:hypothetical protein